MPPSFVRRLRNNMAQSDGTTHTRAPARQKQANLCLHIKDESEVFVVWEEEHKEPRRTTTTCCSWSKRSLCATKARRSLSRRLAARTPNRHIPFISTPWISIRLSACVLCTLSPSRQSCEIAAGVFIHARTDSKDFLRSRNCENKRGQWQPPLCFRFSLGDSHVALLLGMTFEAVCHNLGAVWAMRLVFRLWSCTLRV